MILRAHTSVRVKLSGRNSQPRTYARMGAQERGDGGVGDPRRGRVRTIELLVRELVAGLFKSRHDASAALEDRQLRG
jgi:hypothetical protein